MLINPKIKKAFSLGLTICSFFSFATPIPKAEFGQIKSEGRQLYIACMKRNHFKFCEAYQYHLRNKDKNVEAVGPMISVEDMKLMRKQLLLTNQVRTKEVKENNVNALTPKMEQYVDEAMDPDPFQLIPVTKKVGSATGLGLLILPATGLADALLFPATFIGWSVAAMVKAGQRKHYKKASYTLTGMTQNKKVRVSEEFFDKLVKNLRDYDKASAPEEDNQG